MPFQIIVFDSNLNLSNISFTPLSEIQPFPLNLSFPVKMFISLVQLTTVLVGFR